MKEVCPKCGTELLEAPGIGPFCPNKECDVIDNIINWDAPKVPWRKLIDPVEVARKQGIQEGLQTAIRICEISAEEYDSHGCETYATATRKVMDLISNCLEEDDDSGTS